uniref:Ribosomal protein S1 n=1 Tax=Riquetophycus sp. TaxID=1897556 RepID=A0A1C9C8B5_9FLOR|nr:ribosomal protein S1 [Riquetophycus sp.]
MSFTNNDFASVLNQYNYHINAGDIVAGTIFSQEKYGFLVDIGEEIAGYIPLEETSILLQNQKNTENYLNNETREFFILAYHRKSKQLLLSIKRLEYIRAWKRIKQLESEDTILELKVAGFNKGGIITLIEGLQGFIPNSHLINDLQKSSINHQYIKCKLLLADEKNNKIILSHKKAILEISTNKFKIGDIVIGKIMNIKSYGAFIQIYGVPALLHISEIGYKNIIDIHTIFNIGDRIKVKILHIDLKQGRLSVSRKYLDNN